MPGSARPTRSDTGSRICRGNSRALVSGVMAAGVACNAPAAVCGSHAGKAAASPASGAIEVEQKFLFGPGTEEKLVTMGATLVGSVSFRDRYFDTPNWRLTLADHWLRDREGAGWELKCPLPLEGAGISGPATESQSPRGFPQAHDGSLPDHSLQLLEGADSPGPTTQYQEVTRTQDIVARVCGLLGVDLAAGWHDNVAKAVEELGLEEFASYVTSRRKYQVGELSIDLDEADFGHAVGEVEAVVEHQEDVPEALERIQKLGRQLGFDEKTRIHGKMFVYLQKFRPAHYESLVRARGLKKVVRTAAVAGEKG
ncbi:thiamine-triphosphatase isoform X2 [Eublepharis macularius]|uniref:Thiamine-triphosphatase n=1 Tax=Eublepharis macularius TaxID=481883 RepID=A0AA97LE30_EUBMA|nr:thiamine-triphosphatase isoform X2 [Eublepharis macularius]